MKGQYRWWEIYKTYLSMINLMSTLFKPTTNILLNYIMLHWLQQNKNELCLWKVECFQYSCLAIKMLSGPCGSMLPVHMVSIKRMFSSPCGYLAFIARLKFSSPCGYVAFTVHINSHAQTITPSATILTCSFTI